MEAQKGRMTATMNPLREGRARGGLIGCPRTVEIAGGEAWDEGRCSAVQLQIVPGAASDETQRRDK